MWCLSSAVIVARANICDCPMRWRRRRLWAVVEPGSGCGELADHARCELILESARSKFSQSFQQCTIACPELHGMYDSRSENSAILLKRREMYDSGSETGRFLQKRREMYDSPGQESYISQGSCKISLKSLFESYIPSSFCKKRPKSLSESLGSR